MANQSKVTCFIVCCVLAKQLSQDHGQTEDLQRAFGSSGCLAATVCSGLDSGTGIKVLSDCSTYRVAACSTQLHTLLRTIIISLTDFWVLRIPSHFTSPFLLLEEGVSNDASNPLNGAHLTIACFHVVLLCCCVLYCQTVVLVSFHK